MSLGPFADTYSGAVCAAGGVADTFSGLGLPIQ